MTVAFVFPSQLRDGRSAGIQIAETLMTETPSPAASAATSKPGRTKRASRKKLTKNKVFRWIRRIHLYSGLALLPFAMLYGVTGWLFNHPSHLASFEEESLRSEEIEKAGVTKLPEPSELAREVVQSLESWWKLDPSFGGADSAQGPQSPAEEAEPFTLIAPERAYYDGRLIASTSDERGKHTVLVSVDRQAGEIRMRPKREEVVREAPFDVAIGMIGSKELAKVGQARFARIARSLLESRGLDATELQLSRIPSLHFNVRWKGKDYALSYKCGAGSVRAIPMDRPRRSTTLRSFLIGLHEAKGYPDRPGVRLFWGLLVDFMSVFLVFWSLSGIVMWLQMKTLRRLGLWFLALAIVLAGSLGFGMFDLFTS